MPSVSEASHQRGKFDDGSASVAKLVHNLSGYMIQTALAEAFTMGVKAGVDPLTLWKAVRNGVTGRRRTFDGLAEHFLPNVYDPARFALKLAHKDVSLATQVGHEVGVPMRLANLTLEEMTEALGRGWEGREFALVDDPAAGARRPRHQGRSRRYRRLAAREQQRVGRLQHLQRLLALGRREGAVELGQHLRRELDVERAEILLHALAASTTWGW